MIPKIIHYIWLGEEEPSASIYSCIESWRKLMPDYQFMKWDNQVVDQLDFPFVKEAFQVKKWAFASDVIRLWALYEFGGIYLDTDVMVYKSFDDLLDNHAFIGRECCLQIMGNRTEYHLTSFCFGAEPKNEYIKRCLHYYKKRHFILSEQSYLPNYLKYDMRNASYIHSEIARTIGYDPSALANPEQKSEDGMLTIYPYPYFADNTISDKAYCHHMSFGSWRDKKNQIKMTFKDKVKWRVIYLTKIIFNKFNFTLIEIK